MRKINFLLAMAFLVFIFSGCGGSASSDSTSTDASTLHTTISNLLTGTWVFDESDFTGKATSTTGTSILFYSVKNFRMSFSDVAFDNATTDSEASVTVFYSYSSSARYESTGTAIGDFSIKSYSDTSTTKTKEMTLARITDDEWVLSSSSSSVPTIVINKTSSRQIEVTLTGTVYFSSISENCTYTITAPLVKSSSTPSTDESDYDEETTTSVSSILEGTWKLITEDSATATSTTQGTSKVLDLRLATDIYLNLSNIALISGDTATSQTGSIDVQYAQKWQAFYSTNNSIQASGDFTFSKNETMKFAHLSDSNVWRIEDINNADENIVITIDESDNTIINTEWKGLATTLDDGDTYYYEITASFRKQ